MIPNIYTLKGKVWLYPGSPAGGGSWHFVTLPKKDSEYIKKEFGGLARGWGSLPVNVTIGKTAWKTSIFPDKKAGAYMLPLKAIVRKDEHIVVGAMITFIIEILV